MSLSGQTDSALTEMDVFLALRKIDPKGEEVFYLSSNGTPQPLTYGWVRASHRKLSNKPYPEFDGELPWPTLSHRREDKQSTRPGEVYPLLTEFWPTDVVVEKGEKVVLEISNQDMKEVGPYMVDRR